VTRIIKFSIISFIILFLLNNNSFSLAQTSNVVKIFPPDSKPYGLSYTEHVKNYWKFLASIPASITPMTDMTGERCIAGQMDNASVFYLAGSGAKIQKEPRICNIPSGHGIMFMAGSSIMNSIAESPGSTIDELNEAAKQDSAEAKDLYVEINGQQKYTNADIRKFQVNTGEMKVEFPKNGDGIFGVSQPGSTKAVADGFYMITEPLKPGIYDIHIKGINMDGKIKIGHTDLKYHLIVK
jgi:hypothetical protein